MEYVHVELVDNDFVAIMQLEKWWSACIINSRRKCREIDINGGGTNKKPIERKQEK